MFRGCRIAAGEGFEAPEAGSEAAGSLQQLLSRLWKQILRLQDRCGGLGSLRESGSLQGPEPGALQEPGSLREPGSLQGQAPGSLRIAAGAGARFVAGARIAAGAEPANPES